MDHNVTLELKLSHCQLTFNVWCLNYINKIIVEKNIEIGEGVCLKYFVGLMFAPGGQTISPPPPRWSDVPEYEAMYEAM
jgi:hypothetical protein